MKHPKKLNEFAATAICGNDITSSCLYVSSLTILYTGQYAWLALLIVAAVLFLFRRIYGEVVGALPLNGGAYNVLLNTTSKSNASVAACLTILSYMATAVISGSEAMHYLHGIFPGINVMIATVILITIFLFLVMSGISDPTPRWLRSRSGPAGGRLILDAYVAISPAGTGRSTWQVPHVSRMLWGASGCCRQTGEVGRSRAPVVSTLLAFGGAGELAFLPFPSWQALVGLATILGSGRHVRVAPVALHALRVRDGDRNRPVRQPPARTDHGARRLCLREL